MEQSPTVYDAIGPQPIADFAVALYRRIDSDPTIRAMFPSDLSAASESVRDMREFLIQFFGGPTDYSDRKGHPRLRARHMRFPIDQQAREAWLGHALSALDEVAALTPGFSGADLANLVNEATIVATRRQAAHVTLADFSAAIERIVAGLEKRKRLINPAERRTVAHHEIGHALVALSLPGSDVVHKVSIIPRGIGALGYTMQRPLEDRYLMTREELQQRICVLL